MNQTIRPLVAAGMLLGVAFAALIDGILLHQVLQWHHMICQERSCHPLSIADLQKKDRADGIFHLGAYAILLLGTAQLFQAGRLVPGHLWSGKAFLGAILTGFGLFNVVEGIIDHHILQIHHVRFGAARTVWDLGFLAISVLVLGAGVALLRAAPTTLSPQGGKDTIATQP